MLVIVINLPKDVDRRQSIEKQLASLGLEYEVLPAISGAALSPEDRARAFDERRFVRNEGRRAQTGEIGCALSHIAAYRIIAERQIPFALILEDDAWLNPNVPELLSAVERKHRPDAKSILLLTWVASALPKRGAYLWSTYYVAGVRIAWCSHGYVVSRAAAEALLKSLYPVSHLADCWNWLRRHRVVDVSAIQPTCITADLSFETQTSKGVLQDAANNTFAGTLMRKTRRAIWRLIDHVSALLR